MFIVRYNENQTIYVGFRLIEKRVICLLTSISLWLLSGIWKFELYMLVFV
jgi:hypothetical protein